MRNCNIVTNVVGNNIVKINKGNCKFVTTNFRIVGKREVQSIKVKKFKYAYALILKCFLLVLCICIVELQAMLNSF